MPRLPIARSCALVALSLGLLAGCTHDALKQPDANLGAGDDWPGVGGDADETGYSRLAEIAGSSVNRLGLAWALDLPGEVTLEAAPLEVGGTS